MRNSDLETISYYNDNAENFIETTANVELGELQQRFASMLPKGGRILDLGCGSGRDSLSFLKLGFTVDAMDGSEAMVAASSKLTGLPVVHAFFDDYDPPYKFDGIWACSSLLHVPLKDLPGVIGKYASSLKPGGVFYMSFKLGSFQGNRNGRWFTDLDEESFKSIVNSIERFSISSLDITSDVRPNRENEKWLNAWCVREK